MEEDTGDALIVRVGTFFMVLGFGLFFLFVVSDIADRVEFDYLFISMVMIAIGWYFRRKKAPPPPAGRFSWLKGVWSKRRGGGKSSKEE